MIAIICRSPLLQLTYTEQRSRKTLKNKNDQNDTFQAKIGWDFCNQTFIIFVLISEIKKIMKKFTVFFVCWIFEMFFFGVVFYQKLMALWTYGRKCELSATFKQSFCIWIYLLNPTWVTEALNTPQKGPNMVFNGKLSQPYSLWVSFLTKTNVLFDQMEDNMSWQQSSNDRFGKWIHILNTICVAEALNRPQKRQAMVLDGKFAQPYILLGLDLSEGSLTIIVCTDYCKSQK